MPESTVLEIDISAGGIKKHTNLKANEALVSAGMQKFFQAFTGKNITKLKIASTTARVNDFQTTINVSTNYL